MKAHKDKALVYCVEAGRLLVFRHVDYSFEEVGIQVPGGSVRSGETPEAAALRELCEETGHDTFVIERELGSDTYDITPYRAEIQNRHFYLARPTAPLPARWFAEEAHDGTAPPTRLEFFWIPLTQGHVLQSGQGALLGAID
ncbi:NUDIX domain-containing protein [Asticcacaulis sp. YBE204]|uniref:NUDIX hydrolase n=1 Tax=Asticcacaulis sp. YBE204 TaxID=1282363 RepID=UPI0003C41307|nr:NUDIX domain-containing protein [Asticcacaulis sp. YBE204]ESQ77505.1 hypothetical protein AEYBE204_17345 [Asticcacaulis sp. YBE204]